MSPFLASLLPLVLVLLSCSSSLAAEERNPLVVRLVVATDHAALQRLWNSDSRQVISSLMERMTRVNQLFAPFDVYLQLTGLYFWPTPPFDPYRPTLESLLDSEYLNEHLASVRFPYDALQLWTSFRSRNKSELRVANQGSFCTRSSLSILSLFDPSSGNPFPEPMVLHLIANSLLLTLGVREETCACTDAAACVTRLASGGLVMPSSHCVLPSLREVFRSSGCGDVIEAADSKYPLCGNHIREFDELCDCLSGNETCTKCCVNCKAPAAESGADASCYAGGAKPPRLPVATTFPPPSVKETPGGTDSSATPVSLSSASTGDPQEASSLSLEDPTAEGHDDRRRSKAALIGGTVAAVVAILVMVGAITFVLWRRSQRRELQRHRLRSGISYPTAAAHSSAKHQRRHRSASPPLKPVTIASSVGEGRAKRKGSRQSPPIASKTRSSPRIASSAKTERGAATLFFS